MKESESQILLDNLLKKGLNQLAIDMCCFEKIQAYLALLSKWNKTYNLTAITNPRQMITHHVLDSLSVYRFIEGKTIIDVGTGGGIPGVLLAIVDNKKKLTLLDCVSKKTRFLRHVRRELMLDNIEIIEQRVGNYSPETEYDVIISRAFSKISNFLSWAAHLGGQKSQFLAMKGPKTETIDKKLPFDLLASHEIDVPFLDEQRNLYIYQKNNDVKT